MLRRFQRGALWLGLVAVVAVAACAGSTHHPRSIPSEADATPPPGLSGPALLAWQIWHVPRPARDLISLAERLGHVAGPIAPVVRTSPLNEQVGQEDSFWILTTSDQYARIQAKLVYITPHAYVYVEDGAQVDLSALKMSADLFENSIYVTDRRFFGTEWSPGIDDDPHITILNAPDITPSEDGYFNSDDEYPASVAPNSNEREMIYLRIGDGALDPGTEAYNAALAHEFQRLIHWHMHPADPAWVEEGLSVLAQHINGFETSGFDTAFLAQPDTQLDAWSTGSDLAAHYGAGYLFLDYLAEHYGGYPILSEMESDPAQVPLNIDDTLAENGSSDRFDAVFAKWVMANALNDVPQGSNGTYTYKTVQDEHATPQTTVTSLPFSAAGTVHQYAAEYYSITPPSSGDETLNIGFNGAATVPLLTAGPPPASDTNFWWSNRGDNMDSTLTRSFDLTSVAPGQPIVLNFALWYDLEPEYDYGYVEVSSDNGATWQPLAIAGSHTDNPHGNNYGNGLTGTNSATGTTWTPVSVDLSAYAGKKIQVRFESVTDSGSNGQGMAVTDISIPAIGYTDAAQSTNGWDAKGWLLAANVLPQQYAVQVALIGSDGSLQKVEQVPLNAANSGSLAIPHFGSQVSQALVAVAAMAPATTIPASYTVSLTAS
jgi:immune inhibitor A